jgi:putative intracellular protease/amidase
MSEVQDYVHFTYEDDQFPTRGAANCIRAIVEKEWKYAVYYDPFKGAPVEYEMYDLKNDPYESTNLAHPAHYGPAYAEQRRRLHNRLLEVMQTHGTTPPEVLFPTTEAFEQAYETPQDVYHDPVHTGVRRRQQFYSVILVLTALAALYQLFFQGALLLGTILSFVVGVVLGIYFFSRMTQLTWDDEQGQIVPKMDLASVVILLLYVVFVVIGNAPFLTSFIQPSTVNAASSAFVAGIMIGQIRSLRRKIQDILGPGESSQRAYSTRIDIAASAEQVWNVLTDFETYPAWNPLLSSVQGKLTVGSELIVQPAFVPTAVRATVTVAEPPNLVEWEDHVPLNLLTPVFSVRLLPLAEDRTRVIIAETFTGPLLPLVGRRLDRQMPPLYEAMGQKLERRVMQRIPTASAAERARFDPNTLHTQQGTTASTKGRNFMKIIIRSLALLGVLIAAALFVAGAGLLAVVIFVLAYAALFYLALPRLLNLLGVHPHYKGREFNLPGKRALVIGTNHDTLGDTGNKTGVALSELSVPYYQFLDAGMQVDLASVNGGNIPIDPQTSRWPIPTPADRRFLKDETAMNKIKNSLRIDDIDFKAYDVVFMAGGWGASYDLGYSELLGEKTTDAYLNGAVLGSVCHGALGFLHVKDENGKPLLQGRNATGVTDKQVRELGINITPMHPETELRKAGAKFNSNTAFNDFFADITVVDGRLVTGQNQNAGAETAQKMMMLVEKIAEGQRV